MHWRSPDLWRLLRFYTSSQESGVDSILLKKKIHFLFRLTPPGFDTYLDKFHQGTIGYSSVKKLQIHCDPPLQTMPRKIWYERGTWDWSSNEIWLRPISACGVSLDKLWDDTDGMGGELKRVVRASGNLGISVRMPRSERWQPAVRTDLWSINHWNGDMGMVHCVV